MKLRQALLVGALITIPPCVYVRNGAVLDWTCQSTDRAYNHPKLRQDAGIEVTREGTVILRGGIYIGQGGHVAVGRSR